MLFTSSVIPCVPLGKCTEAITQWCRRSKTKVLLQWSGICKGYWHIASLHWNKFLVCIKVIVRWEPLSCNEFLLENGDKVKEILRSRVADVIYFIWRNRKCIFTCCLLWCVLHHANHTLNNVIHISEVAFTISVIENLDGLAFTELVCEAEVCHIGTTGRTIDGEEAKACGWDVVELTIGMCHEFVALLGGCIERDGIIDLVIGRVWHLLVGAIDAT